MEDLLCNKCGKSCMNHNEDYSINIKFSTGYFSEALSDGYNVRFRLCEFCVRELMLSFETKPYTTQYFDGEGDADDMLKIKSFYVDNDLGGDDCALLPDSFLREP